MAGGVILPRPAARATRRPEIDSRLGRRGGWCPVWRRRWNSPRCCRQHGIVDAASSEGLLQLHLAHQCWSDWIWQRRRCAEHRRELLSKRKHRRELRHGTQDCGTRQGRDCRRNDSRRRSHRASCACVCAHISHCLARGTSLEVPARVVVLVHVVVPLRYQKHTREDSHAHARAQHALDRAFALFCTLVSSLADPRLEARTRHERWH